MKNLQPKGAKVIVETVEKENKEDKTPGGIILAAKEKDSGDNALLCGHVLKVGTPEVNDKGHVLKPGVQVGMFVWFNRYDSFKILNKGLKTYWVVPCQQIYCVGQIV